MKEASNVKITHTDYFILTFLIESLNNKWQTLYLYEVWNMKYE